MTTPEDRHPSSHTPPEDRRPDEEALAEVLHERMETVRADSASLLERLDEVRRLWTEGTAEERTTLFERWPALAVALEVLAQPQPGPEAGPVVGRRPPDPEGVHPSNVVDLPMSDGSVVPLEIVVEDEEDEP